MAAAEQVAVPAQDRVGRDDQVKLPQCWPGDAVQECGEEGAIGWGETWFADLTLQDCELVAQDQDFDVLVGAACRQ
jgi:hypothetical protein